VEFYNATEPGNRQNRAGNGSQKTILFWPYVLYGVFLFVSCGIEDYVYLEPVEYVTTAGSTIAHITIPDNTSNDNFRYYAIFYRIYISDRNIESITTSGQRNIVNPALASHYNSINPYTINDNVSPSSIGTVFSSLKYHQLFVQINTGYYPMSQILTKSPVSPLQSIDNNDIVEIVFANAGPYLKINYNSPPGDSGELLLRRSDGFTASPDRTFFNSTGTGSLTDESTISESSNVDVEKNPGMTFPERHTYVSLYIAAAGIDSNFTAIYSRPKHVGVFRLPQKP
jgi:hypothetical protein